MIKRKNPESFLRKNPDTFLRKNDDEIIRRLCPHIEVNRGLSKEEYEILLNDLIKYIDYFKHTYEDNDFDNGQKRAFYLLADVIKCQILSDDIKVNINIKKYVDELLNIKPKKIEDNYQQLSIKGDQYGSGSGSTN